jgi:hypothetical protein
MGNPPWDAALRNSLHFSLWPQIGPHPSLYGQALLASQHLDSSKCHDLFQVSTVSWDCMASVTCCFSSWEATKIVGQKVDAVERQVLCAISSHIQRM